MLVDSHCHLNFVNFRETGEKIARDFLRDNYALVTVGAQKSSSQRAVELAEKFPRGVYAAVGLHPIHLFEKMTESFQLDGQKQSVVTDAEDFSADTYRRLAGSSDKVKAIGEVGLDYYYFDGHDAGSIELWRQKQFAALQGFIALADELSLPLILHCRGTKTDPYGAYDDLFGVLREAAAAGRACRGVVHCFGGNRQQASEFVALGFYLGVTGIVTFGKSAAELEAVVSETPLNRLLIETDAPFLAPAPHRGRTNQPQYVALVAEKIAAIKNLGGRQVADQTTANAKELFNI